MPVQLHATSSARPRWQQELADAIRDPAELLSLLELDPALLPAAQAAAAQFPLRVPRGFVARMRPGDPHDPLLRQVLPLADELRPAQDYLVDPVGDLEAMRAGGVLHKYHGRVLLVITGACAIHCRYCFRRHFPYAEANAAAGGFAAALDYIRARPDISEVILSGGDPLVLNDRRLSELARQLAAIPHLRRLRIHSRLPIVLPSRIDADLLDWLTGTRLQPVLVVHANHPRELSDEVAAAAARLRERGVTLLNQAVLLAGVNDDAEVLVELSERLFALGILPYYLHALDRVQGASHFNSDQALRSLLPKLRARLPGYLVPRAVREEPGRASKTPLPY
ncbi:MAG: EF-P beta-lysylation protein EpmB [Xanthomonadaceae bacterium]|nr:EF-P beta-lysylation protein EpmB [Xanthomonadaceae bacterium]